MAKHTVYVESTVISYYVARRSRDIITAAHQEITHDWWISALPRLEPFISQIVIDEISRGDKEAIRHRIAATSKFKVVAMTDAVSQLAERYFKAIAIPEKAQSDALHLALATLHGMDYLVSWNCTHIASARVRGIVESLNDDLGYLTPIICTPEELMEVEP